MQRVQAEQKLRRLGESGGLYRGAVGYELKLRIMHHLGACAQGWGM